MVRKLKREKAVRQFGLLEIVLPSLTKTSQTIDIKDLSNSVTRSFKPPQTGVMDIHSGGAGNVITLYSNSGDFV